MPRPLGELLVASGALSEEDLRAAQAYQRNGGIALVAALRKLGKVEPDALARAHAKSEGLPFVDLRKGKPSAALVERVPAEFCRVEHVLPVAERDGRLVVAIDDPSKRILVDQLEFMLGVQVSCALAEPGALAGALERSLGPSGDGTDLAAKLGQEAVDEDGDAPIIRLVTRLFQDALAMRASDIHVEPSATEVRIRFRIDGLLREVARHPLHLAGPLVSRLKIMATMDIAEKRKPQDGRIGLKLKQRPLDVRVSLLPSNHGESIVLRLLDKSQNLLSLRDLGFDEEDHRWFQRLIRRPNGIVLVTGPTGSGKTTTLYAALAELNRPDVKILTAEDPVEYHISGINQVQVHPKIGLTFARILKAMLRAAPNIILVGEIRDLETAEIAIQASLTGHLVFSTLHTNDASSALTRLVDMGVKPFLVSSSIQAVIAQRLVRRLCRECAEEYAPSAAELVALEIDPSLVAGRTLYRAAGCPACEGTGYRGRLGLFEVLEMDDSLREMTYRGEGQEAVRRAALASGRARPLLADGARKVLAGETSVTEVLRVTRATIADGATADADNEELR